MTLLRWLLLGAVTALVACLLAVVAVLCLSGDEPDTYFSDRFTEDAFEQLALGTSRDGTAAMLGEPLGLTCGDDRSEVWHYSARATGAERYVDVSLRFGSDGRLTEKRARVVSEEPTWPGRAVVPMLGRHAVGACDRP
ncbi:MAG: hypothetical protein ACOZQL_25525 [Myxococcota bacterium]